MTASASQLTGLAPPTPLPCERCGHSPPTARVAVAGKRVCIACADQLVRDARPAPAIWPTFLIFATGFLSPLAPPVLAAINWARLGDRRRVRDAVGLVILGAVCSVGQVISNFSALDAELTSVDVDRQLPFVLVALGVAFFATLPLRRRYTEHRLQGGRRASVWPALLIGFGLQLAIGFPVLGYMLATGKVTVEQLQKKNLFELPAPPADATPQPPTAGGAT